MTLARETAQLAIFDFSTMESFPVALPLALNKGEPEHEHGHRHDQRWASASYRVRLARRNVLRAAFARVIGRDRLDRVRDEISRELWQLDVGEVRRELLALDKYVRTAGARPAQAGWSRLWDDSPVTVYHT